MYYNGIGLLPFVFALIFSGLLSGFIAGLLGVGGGIIIMFSGGLVALDKQLKARIFLGAQKSPYGTAGIEDKVWTTGNCAGSRTMAKLMHKI